MICSSYRKWIRVLSKPVSTIFNLNYADILLNKSKMNKALRFIVLNLIQDFFQNIQNCAEIKK